MKILSKSWVKIFFIGCLVLLFSGCTVIFQTGRRSDMEKIDSLSDQVKKLKMTEQEYLKLKQAYDALSKSLSQEIKEKKVSLDIEQKGLVITFVDSVLFDSGKAKLRSEALLALDKVVAVCQEVIADREVGIEGHTDNQPIKYSGWKSNWELSVARATSVLHYLVEKGISATRLAATGYGEYRPKATNLTTEGRQKNRRVEIVILPERLTPGTLAPSEPVSPKETPHQGKYKK